MYYTIIRKVRHAASVKKQAAVLSRSYAQSNTDNIDYIIYIIIDRIEKIDSTRFYYIIVHSVTR